VHIHPVQKGIGNTHVNWEYPDYRTSVSKAVTYIHNHALDAEESCNMIVNVPDKDIFWTYSTLIPYVATLEFSIDDVYTGGTPLVLYNKDLNNYTDVLGLTAVCAATITTPGTLLNSTRYGAASTPSRIVGASFGASWFLLPRNTTFTLTVTSHTNLNNIVTRFTFLEV
jgi:hypothetical protein